jgi:hypothetical protein
LDACFLACSAAVKPNVSYCWDVSKALPPISCKWCPNSQQINSISMDKIYPVKSLVHAKWKKLDTLGLSGSVKCVYWYQTKKHWYMLIILRNVRYFTRTIIFCFSDRYHLH